MTDTGDRYRSLFLSEAEGILASLQEGLASLEEGRDDVGTILDELFRQSHSMKGMAASLGHEDLARLAHALEDVFQALRHTELLAGEEEREILWAGVDALAAGVEAERRGVPREDMENPAEALRDLARVLEDESQAAEAPTDVAPQETYEVETSDEEPPPELPEGPEPEVEPVDVATDGVLLEVTGRLSEDLELPAARMAVLRRRLDECGDPEETGDPPPVAGGAFRFRLRTTRERAWVQEALQGLDGVLDLRVSRREEEGPRPAVPADAQVRVPASVMDTLLEETTELLVHHAHLERLAAPDRAEMRFTLARLRATTNRILNGLLESRLTPFASQVPYLERTVREVGRRLGKRARLSVEGAEVRLDRALLEGLRDPLTHLIRNALDHGIEPAREREAEGKPSHGSLSLRLRRESDAVELVLADDGRGFDLERLRRRAVEGGAVDAATASRLSAEEALLLATLPGISTAEQVSDISGRGVGLDAVRDRVEALGGSLGLDSEPGGGTRVTLRLPPTVAVLQVFLVRVAGDLYAVPVRKVEETVALRPGVLRRLNGRALLSWRDDLAEAFPLAEALRGRAGVVGERGTALLYRQRMEPRAAVVDEVLGCRELVIRPLLGPLEAMGELTGAAVLGDGGVAPVLDLENVGPVIQSSDRAPERRTA